MKYRQFASSTHSDDDGSIPAQDIKVGPGSNVAAKVNIIDGKLTEAIAKGQKPTVNAVAQGFQPSQPRLATQVNRSLE